MHVQLYNPTQPTCDQRMTDVSTGLLFDFHCSPSRSIFLFLPSIRAKPQSKISYSGVQNIPGPLWVFLSQRILATLGVSSESSSSSSSSSSSLNLRAARLLRLLVLHHCRQPPFAPEVLSSSRNFGEFAALLRGELVEQRRSTSFRNGFDVQRNYGMLLNVMDMYGHSWFTMIANESTILNQCKEEKPGIFQCPNSCPSTAFFSNFSTCHGSLWVRS